MYIATVDTGYFNWMALGATEAEALTALRDGYARHARKVPGADPALMNELIEGGDVNVYPISAGACLRDGALI